MVERLRQNTQSFETNKQKLCGLEDKDWGTEGREVKGSGRSQETRRERQRGTQEVVIRGTTKRER